MAEPKRRKVQYSRFLISYIDVLGFGALIESRKPGYISKVLRVFRENYEFNPAIQAMNRPSLHFVNFSDLCVSCIEADDTPNVTGNIIFYQLFFLAAAQIKLIQDYQLVVRGAVTLGQATRSHRILFGPGIVDAYRVESKDAKYPRIVVSSTVIREVDQMKASRLKSRIEALLQKGRDGHVFIDYLGLTRQLAEYQPFLKIHRAFVEKQLKLEESAFREKYEWLLAYQQDSERKPRIRDLS